MKLFSLSRTQDYSSVGVFHFILFFLFFRNLFRHRVERNTVIMKSAGTCRNYQIAIPCSSLHGCTYQDLQVYFLGTRGLCFIKKYCKMLFSIEQLARSWNRRLLMYHIWRPKINLHHFKCFQLTSRVFARSDIMTMFIRIYFLDNGIAGHNTK